MIAVLVVLGAILIASTAQTVAGFGFALIAVPLLVTVLDVRDAVGTAALLSFLNVANVALSTRGHAPWPVVRHLLAGSVCGMPLGLMLLLAVSGDALRIGVGLVSIVMATAIGLGLSIHAPGRIGSFGVGAVSGVLSTNIAINGPPVVLYLQALGYSLEVFRAGMSTFFVLNAVVSLSAFVASGVIGPHMLPPALYALPALVVGHWLGRRLLPRFSPETFRRFVLGLLVVSASASLVDGLVRTFG